MITLKNLLTYIWAGWPRGIQTVKQASTGHIVGMYTTGRIRNLRGDPLRLCSDWQTAVVTKEEFYAAVDSSLRVDASPDINYLPVLSESAAFIEGERTDAPTFDYLCSTQDYKVLRDKWLQHCDVDRPLAEELLAEIARLQIMFREVMSVHVVSERQRRQASAAAVSEEKTLLWLLGRHMGAWPEWQHENTGEVLEAKAVVQQEDGMIVAIMEFQGNTHRWMQPDVQVPLAEDIMVGGFVNHISKAQWVKSRTNRILQSESVTSKLEQLSQETDARLANVKQYGEWKQDGTVKE